MWDFFQRWFGWFWTALTGGFTYIGNLVVLALQTFAGWLMVLLQPLLDLLGGLVYLLSNLVDVLYLVLQVVLYFLQVVVAVGAGIVRTLGGLILFDPAQIVPTKNPYAVGSNLLFDWFGQLGGDVVAGVFAWVVWLIFAGAVLALFAGSRANSSE